LPQEAAFLADLRHRSIVSLFGLRARRFAFLAGEESSQQVAADRSATALVGRDCESGVAFVHSKKVIHRDLRAQNVLVQAMDVEGKELAAKVADFGLAMPVNVIGQRAKADEQLPLRWCAPLLRCPALGSVHALR
jgi:serine/threonine protein kinase